MKIVILGAGRMGQRHAQGALAVNEVDSILMSDINPQALEKARKELSNEVNSSKISYCLIDELSNSSCQADVVIMATTASNRIADCEKALKLNPKFILIEKPLGQSLIEVEELIIWFEKHKNIQAFVNLNTRINPSFIKLKNDIKNISQLKGKTAVSFNSGSIGIGANGIHYIDIFQFLFDTETIEVVGAEIDEQIIPSGRGQQFCDFGGWSIINYKIGNELKASVYFSISSVSTVFNSMNFTFPHGRIIIDEFEQKRYNKYRKPGSEMPVNRYAADYQPQEEEVFESPELKNLTEFWLKKLIAGKIVLPQIKESLESHKAMFQWLNYSKIHKNIFPIT